MTRERRAAAVLSPLASAVVLFDLRKQVRAIVRTRGLFVPRARQEGSGDGRHCHCPHTEIEKRSYYVKEVDLLCFLHFPAAALPLTHRLPRAHRGLGR